MDRARTTSGGPARIAEAWAAMGVPNAMPGYAEAAGAMLWAAENARVMLDLNRTLLDLAQGMLRQQQDAVIESALRALGGSAAQDPAPVEIGFADLGRLSLEAFDRMTSAMRAFNDVVPGIAQRLPEAEVKGATR